MWSFVNNLKNSKCKFVYNILWLILLEVHFTSSILIFLHDHPIIPIEMNVFFYTIEPNSQGPLSVLLKQTKWIFEIQIPFTGFSDFISDFNLFKTDLYRDINNFWKDMHLCEYLMQIFRYQRIFIWYIRQRISYNKVVVRKL